MRMMVTITFNPDQRNEIMPLVPDEQAHIRQLTTQGIVEAIYIGADQTHVWLIMQSESEATVQQTLKTFPLYPYMRAELTPLVGPA